MTGSFLQEPPVSPGVQALHEPERDDALSVPSRCASP
jgi:hypothetical protein